MKGTSIIANNSSSVALEVKQDANGMEARFVKIGTDGTVQSNTLLDVLKAALGAPVVP